MNATRLPLCAGYQVASVRQSDKSSSKLTGSLPKSWVWKSALLSVEDLRTLSAAAKTYNLNPRSPVPQGKFNLVPYVSLPQVKHAPCSLSSLPLDVPAARLHTKWTLKGYPQIRLEAHGLLGTTSVVICFTSQCSVLQNGIGEKPPGS